MKAADEIAQLRRVLEALRAAIQVLRHHADAASGRNIREKSEPRSMS
ncbi:MAG TPA: hypothetical protein VE197_17495 [Mycobacterium sp.]|nr:hypothetical protein [Mycobacterium sp.]